MPTEARSSSDTAVKNVCKHALDASQLHQKKIRVLIVGRGAMGLLHAWFLERAGHEVAILVRPGTSLKNPCGIALSEANRCESDSGTMSSGKKKRKLEKSYIEPLKARCVDIRGALAFLQGADHKSLTTSSSMFSSCILVAVKAHQIKEALRPLLLIPRNTCAPLPPVVMLHNGIIDSPTQDFVDTHIMPHHGCYHMITGACATLLSKEEIDGCMKATDGVGTQTAAERDESDPSYVAVSRPTGPGMAFIFPRLPSKVKKNKCAQNCRGSYQKLHDRTVLTAMVFLTASKLEKDGKANPVESLCLTQQVPAIPQSRFLAMDQGRAEQMVKLSINVSLNGLLARRALRNWCREVQENKHEVDEVDNLVTKGTAALSRIRRVVNHEVRTELPLACEMARLVMRRALRADPNNVPLKDYVISDIAAVRTLKTLDRVPNHVCSTVMDICNGRITERVAMFSTVVNEWDSESEGKEEKNEAADVLYEIYEMLSLWDEYVCASREEQIWDGDVK